jgi:hypothetical protein
MKITEKARKELKGVFEQASNIDKALRVYIEGFG